jgi:AcrR family transcriptional regulator
VGDSTSIFPGNGQRSKGRPGKPSAKARATEQRIFDAATELFHRKGYAATSLQDVADAAGILKGSLYYYIDGKEDLLFAIIQRLHSQAHENLVIDQALGGTARERLGRFVHGHILNFAVNLSSIRVFYTEYRSVTGERHDSIMAQRSEYERYLMGMIKDAVAEGWACPGLDPWLASTAILTMLNSIYLWFDPKRISIDVVAATLTQQALQGLTCPADHDHTAKAKRASSTRPKAPRRTATKAVAKGA